MAGSRSANHRRAVHFLAELRAAGASLFTTRLNVAELYVGVERAPDRAAELRRVEAVLDGLPVLEFDEAGARRFAVVLSRLYRKGRPIGDMDTLIASVALTHGQSIVTRNPKHFVDVPDLVVQQY
jgi:predicted nucleic acid-binding protein